MKTILQLVILINLSLFSQWQEIEGPQSIRDLRNIKTGNDFIVGSTFDPYFSFDSGNTWEKRINGLPFERSAIEQIEVENDLIVIRTKYLSDLNKQLVYFSNDYGRNWSNLTFNLDSNIKFRDLKISKGTIYLLEFSLSSFNILIKTSDFGNNWDTLPQWNSNLGKMDLLDVKNDSIIVANIGGRNSHGGTVKASYLVSTDGGSTWEQRSNQLNTTGLKCLKIHKNHIYLGGEEGFFYSEDFGNSWRSPGMLVLGANVRDFTVVNDTVFLATENGLYKAKDLFRGWEEIDFFKTKRVWEIHYGSEKLFVRSLNRDYTGHRTFYSKAKNLNDFSELKFLTSGMLNSFFIDYPKIYCSTHDIYLKESLSSDFNTILKSDTTFGLGRISAYENNIVCTYVGTGPSINFKTYNFSRDNGNTWQKINFETEQNNFSNLRLFLLNSDTLLITDGNNGAFINVGFNNELQKIESNDNEINNLLSNVYSIFRNKNKIYYFGFGVILESDTNLRNWKFLLNNPNSDNTISAFTKSNNHLYYLNVSGSSINTVYNLFKSEDNGKTFYSIKNKFQFDHNFKFRNVFAIENFVFVSTTDGIYFSKDNGETFEELNDGLSSVARYNSFSGEFHLYGDKILFCSSSGIFYRDLEELGITLSVETRNYLWTNPPYPQPTSSIVKVEAYWDSVLPFTEKDIEIYDLTGVKINTENTLTVQKESAYKGQIIWDASNYKTGIYIMKITHGTETRVRKIMVVE